MGVKVKLRKTKVEVVRGKFGGRRATVDYAVGLSLYSLFSVLTEGRGVDLEFSFSEKDEEEFCSKFKLELERFKTTVGRLKWRTT
jgi:hypothetical protein